MAEDIVRFLAAWALVHETADEGWKAAVARGGVAGPEGMSGGPDAFVDGLSAVIAKEKERLKAALADGGSGGVDDEADVGRTLDDLRFEVGEVRARLESLEASVDAVRRLLQEPPTAGR
ncbi:MAG: hypothetical protein WC971_05765 [Coriobacteriia bacterium]